MARCAYPPPNKVWYKTGRENEYGELWASRPWEEGEKEEYARHVLVRVDVQDEDVAE